MSHYREGFCAAALVVLILGTSMSLSGQACVGAPGGGGIAAEYGALEIGHAQGVAFSIPAGPIALGAGYRYMTMSSDLKGHDGGLRLSVLLGPGHVQVCPTIALGYQQNRWQAGDGMTLTAHTGTARAGLGFGVDLPLAPRVSLAPYGIAHLAFSATVLKLDAPGEDNSVNGDTLTRGDFEYGVIARLSRAYVGVAAHHRTQESAAYLTRFFAGVAFSPGRKGVVP